MKIIGKKELIELLSEVQNNCGDNRGRDGEYLGDSIQRALDMAENLDISEE